MLFQESLRLFHALGRPESCAGVLVGLAGVAAERDDAVRAARWFGAAAGVDGCLDRRLAPIDRSLYVRGVLRTRTQLGEARFSKAWEAGQAMPLQRAIADALEATL